MMRLEGKTAIVHGGSGALGGAAAQAFACEGARVHLVGRTQEKLEERARTIRDAGGEAHAAALDVFDLAAVERHAGALDGVDIALVAVGIAHVQGVPLAGLSAEDFIHPVDAYMRTLQRGQGRRAAHDASAGRVVITISTQIS